MVKHCNRHPVVIVGSWLDHILSPKLVPIPH